MTTDDYRSVLRREFAADEGSFLIQLRGGTWDKVAFARLVAAMEACCRDQDEDTLERWVAHGFWYVHLTVEHQTLSSGMRLAHEPEYYRQAFEKIADLAYDFFAGDGL
jgi:hypothetical protein